MWGRQRRSWDPNEGREAENGGVDCKVKKKTERFNRAGVGVSPPFGFSTEPDLMCPCCCWRRWHCWIWPDFPTWMTIPLHFSSSDFSVQVFSLVFWLQLVSGRCGRVHTGMGGGGLISTSISLRVNIYSSKWLLKMLPVIYLNICPIQGQDINSDHWFHTDLQAIKGTLAMPRNPFNKQNN